MPYAGAFTVERCATGRLCSRADERRERAFRTLVLLAAVVVMNAFDLGFTHSQMARGNFREANIVARTAVEHGFVPATAFKVALLGGGVLILHGLRRHPAAELGAWALVLCHIGLMFTWVSYIEMIDICLTGPFIGGLPAEY